MLRVFALALVAVPCLLCTDVPGDAIVASREPGDPDAVHPCGEGMARPALLLLSAVRPPRLALARCTVCMHVTHCTHRVPPHKPWCSGSSCVRPALANCQDTFGPIEVKSDRYWGAQTQRSLTNFKIGGRSCTMPVEVIKGFGILKKCAAKINVENKTLDAKIGNAIIQVSQELIDGKLDDHFPLVRCVPRGTGEWGCGVRIWSGETCNGTRTSLR